MNQIDVANTSKMANVPNKAFFKRIVTHGLAALQLNAEVCIRIVNVKESAQLNQDYRQKAGPTNVLSFPAEDEFAEEGLTHLGDIVICAEVVQQEAQAQNLDLNQHYAHMTVHGLLHLNGYDHQTDAEAEVMEALEAEILLQLGFTNPYE